jgi:hypothetical protein
MMILRLKKSSISSTPYARLQGRRKMNRKEFLDKFERHLRKYKEKFAQVSIETRLLNNECPLNMCPYSCWCLPGWSEPVKVMESRAKKCPISKDWPYQSLYYERWIRKGDLKNQMLGKVKKVYKT